MDLGIGKFLDMVEQHFGSTVLRVLLLCILFAVLTVTVSTIIKSGIIPAYKFYTGLGGHTISEISAYGSGFLLSIIVGFFGYWAGSSVYIKFAFTRRIEKAHNRAKQRIAETDVLRDKIDSQLEHMEKSQSKADFMMKEVEEISVALEERTTKILKDLDNLPNK